MNRPNQLDVTVQRHVYVENTLVIETSDFDKTPPSPRTRIKTSFRDFPKVESDSTETIDSIERRQFSPNLQRRAFLTPSQQLTKFNEILCETPETPEDKFILPLDTSDLSDVLIKFDNELSHSSYNGTKNSDIHLLYNNDQSISSYNGATDQNLTVKLDKEHSSSISSYNGATSGKYNKEHNSSYNMAESRIVQDVGNDLPESERDLHIILPKIEDKGKVNPKKKVVDRKMKEKRRGVELQNLLRPKKMDPEEAKLREEKEKLLMATGSLKNEIQQLVQQDDDVLREVRTFF